MPVPRKLWAHIFAGQPRAPHAPLNHRQRVGPHPATIGRLVSRPPAPPRPADGNNGPFGSAAKPARAMYSSVQACALWCAGMNQILAALLVQPEVGPLALGVIVLHPHGQRCADTREAVHHQPQQRPGPATRSA